MSGVGEVASALVETGGSETDGSGIGGSVGMGVKEAGGRDVEAGESSVLSGLGAADKETRGSAGELVTLASPVDVHELSRTITKKDIEMSPACMYLSIDVIGASCL